MLNINGDFDRHGNGDVTCEWNFIDYEAVKGKNFAHGQDSKHSFPCSNPIDAYLQVRGSEVNLRIPFHACNKTQKRGDTHPAFQTQGRRHQMSKSRSISGPTKRNNDLQNFF